MHFLAAILLFTTTAYEVRWTLAECPPDLEKPCSCRQNNLIACRNFSNGSILSSRLSSISYNSCNKHFNQLLLQQSPENNDWTEVPVGFTQGLTFDDIQIWNRLPNSSQFRVHNKAFLSTANEVRKLTIQSDNLAVDESHNVFEVINLMTNLEHVALASIDKVPSKAFKSLLRLNFLSIGCSSGSLSIGSEAFYQLKNIQTLELDSSGIQTISSNSFRLQNSSQSFELVLPSNLLNGSSFAIKSLAQFNRPTKINLALNQIDVLPVDVFGAFFKSDRRNELDLWLNPLNCTDCRNAWLAKKQDNYKRRVKNAFCWRQLRGATVFDQKFQHCKLMSAHGI